MRFGPFVKNGQNVGILNQDGGTSSEQAHKNGAVLPVLEGVWVWIRKPYRGSGVRGWEGEMLEAWDQSQGAKMGEFFHRPRKHKAVSELFELYETG